jgi:hypothetical protein
MTTPSSNINLYDTLCSVLDSLRAEAPKSNSIYHPSPSNPDGVIQARSRALLHLFLKARFGLVRFSDRETYVTDGSNDGGVDAFYIDEKNKRIYVLQSKFRATAGNFVAKNMSPSDLLKMDVSRILKGEKKQENGVFYNDKIRNGLQKAIRKLTDPGSYTTQVVLLGNLKDLTANQLKRLIEGYKVDQYAYEQIFTDLLFPVISGTYFTDPNLTIEINLANLLGDTHLDYNARALGLRPNVKLLFVPTREIGRVMHTYKNTILTFNPRSFLELQNNRVNRAIEASIRRTHENEFSLFNNGITIIADSTSISSDTARQGKAQVVLRNPQLVNGGQTAYTLARIFETCKHPRDFNVFRGKEVLLRVITFVGPPKAAGLSARLNLVGEISKASNFQSKVDESDRRSNDPIQLRLQNEFFENYGLFYERKRGEFSDGIHYGYLHYSHLIERERLVRVSLACGYRASQARSNVKKFFTESELPKVLKVAEVAKYRFGYEVLNYLEQKRRSKPKKRGDRYHTGQFGQALRYGQYAVVAVCANRGMAAGMTEAQASDAALKQWRSFERWIKQLPANRSYRQGNSFGFVNYYKGSTLNLDLERYKFSF